MKMTSTMKKTSTQDVFYVAAASIISIDEPRSQNFKLPGAMVRRLMKNRRLTIRSLASKHQLTLKRVREVRRDGVEGFLANEWHYLITGQWLDEISCRNPLNANDGIQNLSAL